VLKAVRPTWWRPVIQPRAELANDVHYSGTVAAAMEAAWRVSQLRHQPGQGRVHAHAARFAAALARQIGAHGLPPARF